MTSAVAEYAGPTKATAEVLVMPPSVDDALAVTVLARKVAATLDSMPARMTELLADRMTVLKLAEVTEVMLVNVGDNDAANSGAVGELSEVDVMPARVTALDAENRAVVVPAEDEVIPARLGDAEPA